MCIPIFLLPIRTQITKYTSKPTEYTKQKAFARGIFYNNEKSIL